MLFIIFYTLCFPSSPPPPFQSRQIKSFECFLRTFLTIFFYNLFINLSMRKNSIAEQEKIKNNQDCSQFEIDFESSSQNRNDNSDFLREENKEKQKRRKRKIYNTKSKGYWDIEEDIRFKDFMIQNRQVIEKKELRRCNKIYKKMSKFVKTRSAEQCRSHHQKYEKQYGKFDAIVQFIMKKTYCNENLTKLQWKQKEQTKIQPTRIYNLKRRLSDSSSNIVRDETQNINGGIQQKKKTRVPISYSILSQNSGYQLKLLHSPQFQLQLCLGLEFVQKY